MDTDAVGALIGATATVNGNAVVEAFVANEIAQVEAVQPGSAEPLSAQAKVVVFAQVAVYVWLLAVAAMLVGPLTAVHTEAPACTTATFAAAAALLAGATCTV